MNLYLFFAILESSENPIQVPALSKWPFDSQKGGHKKNERGHLKSPNEVTLKKLFWLLRCDPT